MFAFRQLGWIPLHWAAQNGNADLVEMLLMAGSDITQRNKAGYTAEGLAHSACEDREAEAGDTEGYNRCKRQLADHAKALKLSSSITAQSVEELTKNALALEQQVRAAFKKFDVDGDGVVTAVELASCLKVPSLCGPLSLSLFVPRPTFSFFFNYCLPSSS
jgi:hypothetical protein